MKTSKRLLGTGAAALLGLVLGVGIGYVAHPDSGSHVLPLTAEEWTALATWLTAGIAAVAASVGLSQASEARRLRIDQAQPFVVATMEPNPSGPETIELYIKNIGNTPARDVSVVSQPPLRATGDGDSIRDVWLPESIPYLAPGQEWRSAWDFGPSRATHPILRDEKRHVLTIGFDGIEGTPRQETTAVLDWAAFEGRTYLTRKTLHDAASALTEIRTTLKKWTEGPRGGLSTIVRSGDAADARRRAQHEALVRAAKANGGEPERLAGQGVERAESPEEAEPLPES